MGNLQLKYQKPQLTNVNGDVTLFLNGVLIQEYMDKDEFEDLLIHLGKYSYLIDDDELDINKIEIEIEIITDMFNPRNKIKLSEITEITEWTKDVQFESVSNSELAERFFKLEDSIDTTEYVFKDNNLYLKGFNTPMPRQLVINIILAEEMEESPYTSKSLINFWKQLVWNPDTHVRKGLFEWLMQSNWAITDDGNLVTYRNVDIKQSGVNREYNEFVTQSYAKVKRWKKSPTNYYIDYNTDTSEYELKVGMGAKVLKDAYNRIINSDINDLTSATIYKGQHIGDYGQHIEIGKPVSMPREECDNDPNVSCSVGLHQRSKSYGNYFGETTLVCLVSPYNVVAIPEGESNKMRVCEYLPIGVAEKGEDGDLLEWEDGTYNLEYKGRTIEDLLNYIENNQISVLKRANLISTDVELNEEELNEIIKNKIIYVR